LAATYDKLKDSQKAKKYVEKALELDPNYPEALGLLKKLNEQGN